LTLAITASLEKACALLSEVKSVDEAVEIRDKVKAIEEYTRRHRVVGIAHADTYVLGRRYERRIGEFTLEMEQHPTGGGRPRKNLSETEQVLPPSKSRELKRLGLTRQDVARYEKMAKLDAGEWSARLETARSRVESGKRAPDLAAVTSASDFDGDAWGTPPAIIEMVRRVLGSIELDPASNDRAQAVVGAQRYYTVAQNGLTQPWKSSTLFLNPPYSDPLCEQFARRFLEGAGFDFSAGVLLVNACTDTAWQRALLGKLPVCFPPRISFLAHDGSPHSGNRYAQAIFYSGPKLPLFRKVFGPLGPVLAA